MVVFEKNSRRPERSLIANALKRRKKIIKVVCYFFERELRSEDEADWADSRG